MIAADYQPLCAAATRRRDRLAATRAVCANIALKWRRYRPAVIATGRVVGGLLAATVWFAMCFALFVVPTP